jgi:hypothetical protein
MTLRILAVVASLVGSFALSPSANADGDPASDILLFQQVSFPFNAPSPAARRVLAGTVAEAKRAGYPIRVAIIQARPDLGAVPQLFGKPQTYARFLDTELQSGYHGVLLVVMAGGYGVAAGGRFVTTHTDGTKQTTFRLRPTGRLVRVLDHVSPPRSGSPNALAAAATSAVRALALAAGHSLPKVSAKPPRTRDTASHGSDMTVVVVLVVVAVSGAALVAVGIRGVLRTLDE